MTTLSTKLVKKTHKNMKVWRDHAIMYIPSACESSCSDVYAESIPLPGIKIVAYDIQKAP